MGASFSYFGRGTYYASYEQKLELLQAETDKLKDQQAKRELQRQRLLSIIFWYCTAAWAVIVAYAAWVIRQPPGTFSVRGHFLRVASVFCWPLAVYTLCALLEYLTGWSSRRRERRLLVSQRRIREVVTALKESTNYEKTLQLLRKYDPDFSATEAKQQARLLKQQSSPNRRVRFSQPGDSPKTPLQLGGLAGGLAGSALRGAGSRMMPALDYLASNLMGDSPALTNALREAHSEGQALRSRLLEAEGRITGLEADNARMRSLLGEEPLLESPPSPTSPAGLEPPKQLALEGPDASLKEPQPVLDTKAAPTPNAIDSKPSSLSRDQDEKFQ